MRFPDLYDPKLAEFTGIMLGDGSIGIYKCKAGDKIKIQHKIQITLDSREIEFIEYVKNLVEDLFGVTARLCYRESNSVDIRSLRRDVLEFLTKQVGLKLSPKWERAIIPKQYMNNILELRVLRGLFDTDGSVVLTNNNGIIYPRLEIKMCPSPMQKQVIDILKRRNFNLRVRGLDKNKIQINLNGKTELKKWLDLIGFSNKKHLTKAKSILKIAE